MSKRQRTIGILGGIAAMVLTTYNFGKGPEATDPGVRPGAAAGGPLSGLTADEMSFFNDGLSRFKETEAVTPNGLGPRFNSDSCVSCHLQPAPGGSSPAVNPLVALATSKGAMNQLPWFITSKAPVREVRFKRNPDGTNCGGVHDLFVITGRSDAAACNITQPNFLPAGNPMTGKGGNPNLSFRIPTPAFGAGLIESIEDSAILANAKANSALKKGLGISGHANAHLSGNANPSAALSNQPVNLYSDLIVHHMGQGLADGITQGSAGPDEFRSAPLWGLGQRVFFLHDGRTSNLIEAIEAHRSPGSEANRVIENFEKLGAQEKQDVLNFLRAL